MQYIVLRIEEDLEFGCEEREEDQPRLAVVTLRDRDGNTVVRKFEDDSLYQNGIDAGDLVRIDGTGRLCKV